MSYCGDSFYPQVNSSNTPIMAVAEIIQDNLCSACFLSISCIVSKLLCQFGICLFKHLYHFNKVCIGTYPSADFVQPFWISEIKICLLKPVSMGRRLDPVQNLLQCKTKLCRFQDPTFSLQSWIAGIWLVSLESSCFSKPSGTKVMKLKFDFCAQDPNFCFCCCKKEQTIVLVQNLNAFSNLNQGI